MSLLAGIVSSASITATAQTIDRELFWQGQERTLRYQPDGEEFVNTNGDKRFTRAIYGTNTGFRFETSDYPEFGLYMPRLAGSVYLALSTPTETVWIKDLETIESRFKSGQRTYHITDSKRLGEGSLTFDAVALSDGDGFTVRVTPKDIPAYTKLRWVYGGANNKRFSREGDIGADPADSFYIKAENCESNVYGISENRFVLYYGKDTQTLSEDQAYENADTLSTMEATAALNEDALQVAGVFPEGAKLRTADANKVDSLDDLLASESSDRPILVAEYTLAADSFHFALYNPKSRDAFDYPELAQAFDDGVDFRTGISSRMKLSTPDPFFNTLGGIYAGAEDAVWQSPGYLHGAIGWRMPLTGWRAAYLADLLGLQERARLHFNGYVNSQVTDVPVTLPPLQDEKLNLARSAKTWGTPMYSNGYIARNPNEPTRMHHYDMNLVFIDELLWHINWTGDLDYAREIFPTLELHHAWEKNVFDPDDDGLYDGYCAIWPSDALQYNGGKGTHSSAYNYRSNKLTAELARKIGEDPQRYEEEAERILAAMNRELWIEEKGWWAEFVDNMGHGMRHESPAIWSIYHAIDSDVHDPFKAYQATRYIDTEIPHIPVVAHGLEDTSNYLVSTTNWQPYMWSINNVAFAEVIHTTLAYWQSGRHEEAFKMYKGAVLDAMYLGSGPGNVTQLSFYDAARGETYRDFADPVSMAVRALVQGMFGVIPDLTNHKLTLRPGFPSEWDFADLETQNMGYAFKREGNSEQYTITPKLRRDDFDLVMEVKAPTNRVESITVNGNSVVYEIIEDSISSPRIRFNAGRADKYEIAIEWAGEAIDCHAATARIANGQNLKLDIPYAATELFDPQGVLDGGKFHGQSLTGTVSAVEGHRTLFAKVESGDMQYWLPVELEVVKPLEIVNDSEADTLSFALVNRTDVPISGKLYLNKVDTGKKVKVGKQSEQTFTFSAPLATLGANHVELRSKGQTYQLVAHNWNIANPVDATYRHVEMDTHFNDKVSEIFEYGKYLTPRYEYTTVQVPTQGMGQWCHPKDLSLIEDSGLRKIAAENGDTFTFPNGVSFSTPGDPEKDNILFTTLWDNYPNQVSLPVSGKASKAYFLIAASTYHMQAHVLNGQLRVNYKDGTQETLDLVLPDNLLPLDQDIFIDGWAFNCPQPRPWRVRLNTGYVSKYHAAEEQEDVKPGPTYLDGGMATLLDFPLDPNKELASLELETIANEVIIGLMGVTLME